MNDESKIPILHDLLFKGKKKDEKEEPVQSLDENTDFEIEQDEHDIEQITQNSLNELKEELLNEKDPTVEESNIDEEIRMILDKHMDKAYRKIIRLIKQKYS